MTTVKTRKRLYASLVTVKPPKETSGDINQAATQDLSVFRPNWIVPQEDSETAERIRTLRLFDAALTPPDMQGAFGLEPWALDTARLARACYHAKRAGMLPPIDSPDSEAFHKAATPKTGGLGYVQQVAHVDRAAMLHGLPCPRYDDSKLETWEDVINLASSLVEEMESRGEKPIPQPQPQTQPQGGGEGGEDEGEGEGEGEGDNDGEDEGEGEGEGKPGQPGKRKPSKLPTVYHEPDAQPKKKPAKVPQYLPGDGNRKAGKIPLEDMEETDPWQIGKTPPPQGGIARTGHCENFDKPDVLKMLPRRRKKGARRRSAYEGAFLARPSRLAVDGKMFKSGIVRGGYRGRGSVMVDMSGSMSWTEADFKALLDILPECSVYGYAGRGGRGRIVLLADRGKTVCLQALAQWKSRMGGGNEVDDSALRFLCRQSQPRVWVSDGGVCAQNCDTRFMTARCNDAIAAGRIVRVLTGKEAAAYLTRR